MDGATLFVPRNGSELREFLFADVEQAYQATDLATLASHLVNAPADLDYDTPNRLFHLVMADGTLGTVTIFRAEQVTAWTLQETQGQFLSVAVLGEDTYVLVERNGSQFIERFDDVLNVDSAVTGTEAAPKLTWDGLDHLEGETVFIVADGAVHASKTVTNGQVSMEVAATTVEIGLPYTHVIEPLPPAIQTGQGANQGGRLRPVAITLRLRETPALQLDAGSGLREVSFKGFGDSLLDAPPAPFTGDKTIRAMGWKRDGTIPLWRIEQDVPLPFTLLSVATEISVNG